MQHCWVRLSERHARASDNVCAGCEYSYACVCVCVYPCLSGSASACMRAFLPQPTSRPVCMHVSSSFLSASQPALHLIGDARRLTQHHTLGDSLSAG